MNQHPLLRTLATTTVLVLLGLLAACGGQAREVPPNDSPWGDCTVEAAGHGGRVVRADTDGSGNLDTVLLFGAGSGPCTDGLVVRDGGGVHGVDVGGLGLDPGTVRVVRLRHTRDRLLLVDSRPRSDGGVQPHLFQTVGGGDLAEVERAGQPLLPFVPAVGGDPATATCTVDGAVALWTAKAHQPPGIVLAWDVTRTTYRVEGGFAREQSSRLAEDGTVDPLMRKRMPQLFRPGAYFADCLA